MNNGIKSFRRDPKLVSRMYFTMFMLGILYAGFSFFLMSLGIPIRFVIILVGIMAIFQYYFSHKMVLKSTGAKEVSKSEEPELYEIVSFLANRYEMPMPKLAVIDSEVPNAFATGRNPKKSLVAVTTGIQKRLNKKELTAVIGHELAHIVNGDIKVLAMGNFFVMLTSFLMQMFFWNMLFGGMGRRREGGGGAMMIAYLATIIVYFIGQLLVLALTRYREYGADHTGAEICGDPGALADALAKISGTVSKIPDQDLRKLQTANAFLIISASLKGSSGMHLWSSHPPVEERIKRLRELQSRM
ncbi:MAG: zinc metalloprotease HtpX [Chloroflexi bacterium]|nr:zinc metalloprotease HtpX [Chloroflexota bacterium]